MFILSPASLTGDYIQFYFVYHHTHCVFALNLSCVGGSSPSAKNPCISTSRTQNLASRISCLKSSSYSPRLSTNWNTKHDFLRALTLRLDLTRFYGQIPLFSLLLLHDLLLPFHWYELNLDPLIQCDRDSLKHRRYITLYTKTGQAPC